MPDQQNQVPVYARDYYQQAIEARYGYYARALRPGMTRLEFTNAVVDLQTTTNFVTRLDATEISAFYDNYEVIASTSQHPDAAATGLDALILRSRTSQRLLVSFGGVGPFQDLNTSVGEGGSLISEMGSYGFPVSELLAFKQFADPIFAQYSSDIISIVGHSKGGALSTALYGDLILQGLDQRVDLVFELSPVGIDVNSLRLGEAFNSLSLYTDEELEYALAVVEALQNGDVAKIVAFGAENDPLAGPGSLTDLLAPLVGLDYFGYYRELISDIPVQNVPHNANNAGSLLLRDFNNTAPLFTPRPALIAGLREQAGALDGDNVIIVIGRRQNSDADFVRIVDPRTGARLPIGLRPPEAGEDSTGSSAIESNTGRVVEFEIEQRNGEDVVRNRTIYDAVDPDTGQPRVAVYQETDSEGRPISTNIRFADNPIGIEFSDIGSALGQQLGYRIAGDNVALSIGASSLLSSVGDGLGDTLDGILGGQSTTQAATDAFSTFGPEVISSLKTAGLGALSSFLTAELVKTIGVTGVAGEALNSGAGAVIGQVISNIAGVNGPSNVFSGVNLAMVGSAVGSFLGTKLASEIKSFETIGGQIGSAVGSNLGLLAAGQFGLLGGPLGVFAAIGVALIGNLIGGLIGSIFGGIPRSGADAVWSEAAGSFTVDNIYSRNGGSKKTAEALAGTVAGTFNLLLEATGGHLADPSAITIGNYGMHKSDFVYRPNSTEDESAITYRVSSEDEDSFNKITSYGIYQGLTDPDFHLVGGNVYVKRAIYSTIEVSGQSAETFDSTALLGNIASAQAYQSYLENSAVINALVSAESDSVFAAETAINLVRAVELGLTKRHLSDWFGGYGGLLEGAASRAVTVDFGFDYDPSSDQVSRLISIGDYVFADTVDIAGQTAIEAGEDADIIEVGHVSHNSDGFEVRGGAGWLADTKGLIINGEATNGVAVSIDVAATIDAGGGADIVHGGDLGNNIFGGSGNDRLIGGALDDWLLGEEEATFFARVLVTAMF